MIRFASLLCVALVAPIGCTLFSRSVPCDDDTDCPAPFSVCVDARCIVPTGTVDAVCGNGLVEGDEDCDDGNVITTDACVNCRGAVCGDGFVQAGQEACDDGNTVDEDDCTSDCEDARCGDGFVQTDVEACDDGNDDTTDDCVNCRKAVCGDGFIQATEEACDLGDDVDPSLCTADCTAPALATVTARSSSDGCSGVVAFKGVVFRLDGADPVRVPVGSIITFDSDPGCSVAALAGCVEDDGPTCTVDATSCDVLFAGLQPHLTVYSGDDDVRLRDAALVGTNLVAIGDRDGTVLSLGRPTTPPRAFAAFTAAGATTVRGLVDAIADAPTRLDIVHTVDGATIVVGSGDQGLTLGPGCQANERGAGVFFVFDGNNCTETVPLPVPIGSLTFKGMAGNADDLFILADFFVQGTGSIAAQAAQAGAVLLHIQARSAVTVHSIGGLEPVGLALAGTRLIVTGRVAPEGTSPCTFVTAPNPGDGVVAVFTDAVCSSAIALRGSDVTVTALDTDGDAVFVGGQWNGSLLVDGGGSPTESTGLDGFFAALAIDVDGALSTTAVRFLQGDGEDRILDLFLDDRSVGVLSSSTLAFRFGGSPSPLAAGARVTTTARDGQLLRSVPIDVGTGGRAIALRRGSGSAFAVVTEHTAGTTALEGIVQLFGTP